MRVVVPSIGVDAPVSVKTIGPDGVMQPPDEPEDVAWYDFSARPGGGGNAVFSAHVDYPLRAGGLRTAKRPEEGRRRQVHLADGSVHDYEVVLSVAYPAATAPPGNSRSNKQRDDHADNLRRHVRRRVAAIQ